MIKLQEQDIYLAAMEREHCRLLYETMEYDFKNPTQPLHPSYSIQSADEWYDDIKKWRIEQTYVSLGIFLHTGEIIGDIALQEIDKLSRCCTIGMAMAKIEHRNRGYGQQAMRLIIDYAFNNMGLERVAADTWETNISAQKMLERLGFTLEGRARKAVYFGRQRLDMMMYGLLAEEWGV